MAQPFEHVVQEIFLLYYVVDLIQDQNLRLLLRTNSHLEASLQRIGSSRPARALLPPEEALHHEDVDEVDSANAHAVEVCGRDHA